MATQTPLSILVLLTEIRNLLISDNGNQFLLDLILGKTQVIQLISRVLLLEVTCEELYFAKLEALWTLICLSISDSDHARSIF